MWSCVGSTNFDRRALQLNDEVSMGVLDAGLASQLKTVFNDDLKFCEERHFDERGPARLVADCRISR